MSLKLVSSIWPHGRMVFLLNDLNACQQGYVKSMTRNRTEKSSIHYTMVRIQANNHKLNTKQVQ